MQRFCKTTTSLKPYTARLSHLGQTGTPHHLGTNQSRCESRCRTSSLGISLLYKDDRLRNRRRASSITGSQPSNYSNHYFSSLLLNTSSLYYLIFSLTGSDNNQHKNQHVLLQDHHCFLQPFGFLFPRGWPRCYHRRYR